MHTPRNWLRLLLDCALFGVMFMLMSYPLTRGLMLHGQYGCAFLVLLILHNSVNWRWYRSLIHGGWQRERIVLNCVNILLLLTTILLMLSALFMAGEVFPSCSFTMPWWARSLHMSANAWLFVLVSCHLGLHGTRLWKKAHKICQNFLGRAWGLIPLGIMIWGVWRFLDNGLWVDMLFLGHARYAGETLPLFLANCAGISLTWAKLTRCLQQACINGRGRKAPPR